MLARLERQHNAKMMRDADLEQAASEYYNPELPYHNFGHALSAALTGLKIAQECRDENIPIDDSIVYCALLFHDAGYHQDHEKLGFESKEALSAKIARDILEKKSYPDGFIDNVEKAILCTTREASCTTTEENAVRAADLSGLAAEFSVFRRNTELLKQEFEILYSQKIEWEQWIERATTIIGGYLRQELRLTQFYSGQPGQSPFHQKIKQNLFQLNAEVLPPK
ncbi:MAG: HD domain-containing protein [Nitrospirales bacterium]|nr:HD domain-containing protein [Nitrospirales bacterium]